MYVNVVVKKNAGEYYIDLGGDVYIPETETALREHDVVSAHIYSNGYATVFIKHKPNECWILHRSKG